ncbi:hypothetical protein BH18ACI3_BH18ACI3_16660 [soil metagenome]
MMNASERLGRYRMVRKLGEGGMGEVYLAEDTRLGRRVALKILPSSVALDIDRMLRLSHEAKSASALNHPNIITIYEINDEDESPFIAMEYVEGETLAKKIKRKEFDLQKNLDVAIQIATALAAAHEARVIHRDIKPDNIILRPDGLVKVLDFGLAKLTEKPAPLDFDTLTTLVKTSPGLVMGTVGYMSPEQARGKSVDARTDIFSFGAVLYEMLALKRPFTGENDVDVIGSILHTEPVPLSQHAPEIPHDLESLVRKALRKNRDERYQTGRELLADLKDLRQEFDFVARAEHSEPRISDFENVKSTDEGFSKNLTTAPRSGMGRNTIREVLLDEFKLHPVAAALIVGVLAIAIIAAGAVLYTNTESSDSFQTMRINKLTASGNVASEQTAISPDGKYVVYALQDAGQQSLWVKQTATSSNVQIVPPADARFNGLTFSRDGDYIYYTAAEKQGPASIYQIPVLGGISRKLLADAGGPVAFSADGSRMAFVRRETSLMIANSDGSESQTLANASEGTRWLRSAWSPDGKTIVSAVYSSIDDTCYLVEVSLDHGTEKPLTSQGWLRISGLGWLPDGKGLIISGRDPETQLSQLWFIGYPDGKPRRITNDLSGYLGLSLTADGKSVISTQQNRLSNIWAVTESGPAQKLTSELGKDEGLSGISWTPEGQIVYTTRIAGTQDLWIVNRDGSGNRQLTFQTRSNFSPAVSPDGRFIAFISSRAGNSDLWRIDIDGGNPVQLAGGPGLEGEPAFSPDGKWVVYDLTDTDNKVTLWKVSIAGGTPVRLTDTDSRRPAVSPDGKFIAYGQGDFRPGFPSTLSVLSSDGGQPFKTLELPLVVRSRDFSWSADGRALIYVDNRDKVDNLWSQTLDGGPPVRLTNFESDRIFRFDALPGGKGFAMARGSENSDVVMITGFR